MWVYKKISFQPLKNYATQCFHSKNRRAAYFSTFLLQKIGAPEGGGWDQVNIINSFLWEIQKSMGRYCIYISVAIFRGLSSDESMKDPLTKAAWKYYPATVCSSAPAVSLPLSSILRVGNVDAISRSSMVSLCSIWLTHFLVRWQQITRLSWLQRQLITEWQEL